MSLASILQRVQSKGKLPEKSVVEKTENHPKKHHHSNLHSTNVKQIDPVVAKLKEKRRLEKELKLQQEREKKGLPPAKTKTPRPKTQKSASTARKPSGKSNEAVRNSPSTAYQTKTGPVSTAKPAKKLKFTDLMKRASQIDQSQLSINIRPKTTSPEASSKTLAPASKSVSRFQVKLVSLSRHEDRSRKPLLPAKSHLKATPPQKSKAPIPIRKPSSVLEQKLKSKSSVKVLGGRYEEYVSEEEELDDFVVSDEEVEDVKADYDRDEIWAMFNKGKKRSYFERYDDYDSDEMEATGAEILDEEFASRRRGELEDRREALEERRLAEAKLAKKLKR